MSWNTEQQPIINLVDKILAAKQVDSKTDTSEWERQIDKLVYDLYGLDEIERKLIEGRASNLSISLGVARITHQVAHYTRSQGLEFELLKKLILQFAHNTGKEGFKLNELFEAVEHSLPMSKEHNSQKRYLTRILKKMNQDLLLDVVGRHWFITDKGESLFNL